MHFPLVTRQCDCRQDERQASQAADELLASVLGAPGSSKTPTPTGGGSKGNSSVYITGLTTYMACRQLGRSRSSWDEGGMQMTDRGNCCVSCRGRVLQDRQSAAG